MSLRNAPVGPIVPSTNFDASIAFYRDKLGLEQLDSPAPDQIQFFAAGNGTQLAVYNRPEGNQAQHTQVGFVVKDIYAVVQALTDNGVVFEMYDFPGLQTDDLGIADMEGSYSAWFKDPDGNILSINQM